MARIDYYGTDEIIKKLEMLGANVEEELEKALIASAEKPKQEMYDFIAKNHHRTGDTEKSFMETIEYDESTGKVFLEIGFNLKGKKNGLPTLYLNYGTPMIQPTFFIDKAIENNIDEIKKIQEETLEKALKNAGLK